MYYFLVHFQLKWLIKDTKDGIFVQNFAFKMVIFANFRRKKGSFSAFFHNTFGIVHIFLGVVLILGPPIELIFSRKDSNRHEKFDLRSIFNLLNQTVHSPSGSCDAI